MAVHAGRNILVKIDTNDTGGAAATWVTVGQQRGGGIGRTSETADATHKDDEPWSDAVATRIGWTISCDGALDPSDTAWAELLTKWEAAEKIYVQVNAFSITGGEYKEGQAIITDLSYEFPDSDVVSYTAEFQGCGSLDTSVEYS